jgi:hypothetical protein
MQITPTDSTRWWFASANRESNGPDREERSTALLVWDRFMGWAVGQGRAAEWSLYFLTATGGLLWLGEWVPWSIQRHVLWLHIAAGLVLFPAIVLPFWRAHHVAKRFALAPRQRLTGRLLEGLLLALLASGIYLVWIGNPGEIIGASAFWIHLLLSLPLLLALLVHVWRRGAGMHAMSVLWAHVQPNRK